jgi:NMD protein affecting ribosome stability and mRNA decay
MRCEVCGTADEFADEITQNEVEHYCSVCYFHRHHLQDFEHHPRCAVCLAREWRGWLRALRILLFRPIAIRPEDL